MLLLDGISIAGYRSFGEVDQYLENLSKINLIIGQNNSGKSNILRVLNSYLPRTLTRFEGRKQSGPTPRLDTPYQANQTTLRLGILLRKNSELSNEIFFKNPNINKQNTILKKELENLLFRNAEKIWFVKEKKETDHDFSFGENSLELFARQVSLADNEWHMLASNLHPPSARDQNLWTTSVADAVNPFNHINVGVDLIPAVRSAREYTHSNLSRAGDEYFFDGVLDHSGIGLVDELFRLQNPAVGDEKDLARFDRIVGFLRTVVDKEDVGLSIPHDKSAIIVEMDEKRLPLEALGTGIEEVVIIAAKATIFDNQIVCLEEPENHLHPTLQRKLMRYLYENTRNQ